MKNYKVIRLPAWLVDNAEYGITVGCIVTRHDSSTILFKGKLIRLGASYTKEIK